jgi:hypothetical protein
MSMTTWGWGLSNIGKTMLQIWTPTHKTWHKKCTQGDYSTGPVVHTWWQLLNGQESQKMGRQDAFKLVTACCRCKWVMRMCGNTIKTLLAFTLNQVHAHPVQGLCWLRRIAAAPALAGLHCKGCSQSTSICGVDHRYNTDVVSPERHARVLP